MGILTNKISKFIYDRGIVSFSLENETPGPNGVIQVDPVINISMRYEDFSKMAKFFMDQSKNIEPVDSNWMASLTSSVPKESGHSESIKPRPEIGMRVGP